MHTYGRSETVKDTLQPSNATLNHFSIWPKFALFSLYAVLCGYLLEHGGIRWPLLVPCSAYFGVTLGGIFRFGVLGKRPYGGIAWGVNFGMGNGLGLFLLIPP